MNFSNLDGLDIPLTHTWTFWFDSAPPKGITKEDFESRMIKLATVATLQEFWRAWNTTVKTLQLDSFCNLRLFKEGIKPLWEDPQNVDGGKLSISVASREDSFHMWSDIVWMMVDDQISNGEDLCGVVLSLRPRGDLMTVWNRDASQLEHIEAQKLDLIRCLTAWNVDKVDYLVHQASVKYNVFRRSPPRAGGPGGGGSFSGSPGGPDNLGSPTPGNWRSQSVNNIGARSGDKEKGSGNVWESSEWSTPRSSSFNARGTKDDRSTNRRQQKQPYSPPSSQSPRGDRARDSFDVVDINYGDVRSNNHGGHMGVGGGRGGSGHLIPLNSRSISTPNTKSANQFVVSNSFSALGLGNDSDSSTKQLDPHDDNDVLSD